MTTRDENRGVVGGNNLRDGDQRMQVVWDQLDHHLVAIAALEGRMQTGFGDINARFDDLSTRLKALRLHTNMNWEKREAHTRDDACDQPVIEPVHANPRGQYEYGYSFDEEDHGKVTENNRYDQDYCIKVGISSFGSDLEIEEFLDWLAKCDWFYEYT